MMELSEDSFAQNTKHLRLLYGVFLCALGSWITIIGLKNPMIETEIIGSDTIRGISVARYDSIRESTYNKKIIKDCNNLLLRGPIFIK